MKKTNVLYLYYLTMLMTGLPGLTTANGNILTNQVIKVNNAWVRTSIPGQNVGAAYMDIVSSQNVTLEKVSASTVGHVEIHKMTMTNGIMKMRMLDKLDFIAGRVYKLAPSSSHLMLFDLKQPFKTGQKVEFKLTFKDQANKSSTVKVLATVKEGE